MVLPRYDSIESTFSVCMLSLNLKRTSNVRLASLLKRYDYSFKVTDAKAAFLSMKQTVNYGVQSSDIVISMTADSVEQILQRFLDAHLIHSPAERCLHKLQLGQVYQPTAKGIAVLHNFCSSFNIHHEYSTTLFQSPFNSMDLFRLESDPITGATYISETMLRVVWNRMLGKKPRYWTNKAVKTTSPYYNQWLSHPHGNCLFQYWDSDGIKLFHNVSFLKENKASGSSKQKSEYQIDYVLSGRGIYQWLMDCTNIMDPKEAKLIASKFTDRNFLRRVDDTLCDEITYSDDFPRKISRTTIYRIAYLGTALCAWADEMDIDNSMVPAPNWKFDGNPSPLDPLRDLNDILDEPGLLLLFRHTVTACHASESLDFLCDMKSFNLCYEKHLQSEAEHKTAFSLQQQLAAIVHEYVSESSTNTINIPEFVRRDIVTAIPSLHKLNSESQKHIDAVKQKLKIAEDHIWHLMNSMIPQFSKDPIFDSLQPIKDELYSDPMLKRRR